MATETGVLSALEEIELQRQFQAGLDKAFSICIGDLYDRIADLEFEIEQLRKESHKNTQH